MLKGMISPAAGGGGWSTGGGDGGGGGILFTDCLVYMKDPIYRSRGVIRLRFDGTISL